MKAKIKWFFIRFLAGVLALLNTVPSLLVILNPLLFIMFLPVGVYAILSWPWIILKDIPDPLHPGESLYWLTYAIKFDEENIIFPSLFRWGIVDLLLSIAGLIVFLVSFTLWLMNIRRGGDLITSGIYGFVRHPQYLGITLLTLGIAIRSLRPISLIAWIILLFGYLVLASLEERSLLETYGQKYEEYSKRTAFIIPFLKISTPQWLSARKPYRYILFIMACFLLIMTVMALMRNMVFSLRSITH